MYFDPAYILFALPALLLSLYATVLTKSRFARYSQVEPSSGMTGAEATRTLLDRQANRPAQRQQVLVGRTVHLAGHHIAAGAVLFRQGIVARIVHSPDGTVSSFRSSPPGSVLSRGATYNTPSAMPSDDFPRPTT